jgi:RNA polymerase sigma-70 factor, ECF subfamily
MAADTDPEFWLREHGPKLLAFAHQCVGCRTDAEDVLQEAFLRFWQHRETARDPLLYLYRCIRNVAVDRLRSRDRKERRERDVALALCAAPADVAAKRAETDERIRIAVALLPWQQREVVALRVWSDMTFEQIGNAL